MVTVSWIFRNDHKWSKTFESEDAAMEFVNSVGLISHPDIAIIRVEREEGADIYLKKGLTHW